MVKTVKTRVTTQEENCRIIGQDTPCNSSGETEAGHNDLDFPKELREINTSLITYNKKTQ